MRILTAFRAVKSRRARLLAAACCVREILGPRLDIEASIFQSTGEQLAPGNREYQEEEEQHQDRVSEERHGVYERGHDDAETLYAGDSAQRADDSEGPQHREVASLALEVNA